MMPTQTQQAFPSSFRLVACARLADPVDSGEIEATYPPGTGIGELLQAMHVAAYRDRDVSYALDYYHPGRCLWQRFAAVCYAAGLEVDPATWLVTRPPEVVKFSVADAEQIERNHLEHTHKTRQRRKRPR